MSEKILIIGDVIFDRFQYGKAIGISAETPTVVAEEGRFESFLGGAGLVARHLEVMGRESKLLTMGSKLDLGVTPSTFEIVEDERWRVSSKMRCFVDGYKMVQYDSINKGRHDRESRTQFIRRFSELSKEYDIVIVSDNRHGVIDREIATQVTGLQQHHDYRLLVDSQWSQSKPNHAWYVGCDTIFMNEKEFSHWAGGWTSEELAGSWDCDVVVKQGRNGCRASIGGMYLETPGVVRGKILDTCGAGDAFLAAYVASESERDIDRLRDANEYAAWSCEFEGTRTPTLDEYRVWSERGEVLL